MAGNRNKFPLGVQDTRYLALLFLLVFALFLPNLILKLPALGKTFLADQAFEWHPWKFFYRESYLSGFFPLWDPYDLCGQPFLAFSHTGALYPLGLSYLLPFPAANTVSILMHLMILVLSCYWLFREIGRSPGVAFVSALSFSLSGHVFIFLNFVTTLHTFTWIPLMFLSALKLGRSLKAGWMLALGASFAMAFAAGDHEMLIYTLFFLFWFALRLPGVERKRFYGLFMLAFALATMLVTAQFLPLTELFHFSMRGSPRFAPSFEIPVVYELVATAFGLARLFVALPAPSDGFVPGTFTYPFYLGFWLVPGILMAILARPSALVRRATGFLWFALAYALIFQSATLHKYLAFVPVLGKIFNLNSLLPSVNLILIMVAGDGLDSFLSGKLPKLDRATRYYLPAYGVLVLASAYLFKLALLARLGLGCALLLFPLWKRWARPGLWVPLLVLIDLYGMALSYFPRNPYSAFDLSPEFVAKFSNSELQGRYLFSSPLAFGESELPFSAGMMVKAGSIDTWMRTPIWQYLELASIPFPKLTNVRQGKIRYFLQFEFRRVNELTAGQMDILDLLNLRWIISRTPAPSLSNSGHFQLVSSGGGGLFIYENKSPLPRAKIFRRSIATSSEEEAYGLIKNGRLDFRNELALPRSAPSLPGTWSGFESNIQLVRENESELRAFLRTDAPAYFFLDENYYPGWQAELDGLPVRIYRADYAFRAVHVPGPGEHELEFVYRPYSFRIGLWSGITSAAGFAFLGLWLLARKKLSGVEA